MSQPRIDDAAVAVAAAVDAGCNGWIAPPGTYLTMRHEHRFGTQPDWTRCHRTTLFDLGGLTIAAESTWIWQYISLSAVFFILRGIEFTWQLRRLDPGETLPKTFTGNLAATVTRTLDPFSTDDRSPICCDLESSVAAWLDTASDGERPTAFAALDLLASFTGDESHQVEGAEISIHDWGKRRARATATKRYGIDGSTGWRRTETSLELTWGAHGFCLERRVVSDEGDEGQALS